MIALTASLFLLFYVLVPGGIFRFALSLAVPLKKFHKTKTQEISFAVLASFLPFWFAMALTWSFVNWPFPSHESNQMRREAYRTVFVGLDNDKELEVLVKSGVFWRSTTNILRRQTRFLIWFYLLVMAEAAGFWWLTTRYGRLTGHRLYDFFADHVLIPSISEWHILLTDFAVRIDIPREVDVDILTTESFLYQGRVSQYFLNAEGDLSGILLSNASRFDREEYSEHRKLDLQNQIGGITTTLTQPKSAYWKKIEGANLFFIPSQRISNLNSRHATSAPAASRAAQARLQERGISASIEEQSPNNAIEH
jgi:hypothetical protein